MVLPVERERRPRKVNVWEIVERTLVERGQETTAGLHRAYKEALKEIYAKELEPFMTWSETSGEYVYRRPYRVRNKQRQFIKRPPKGMTYLSFARYMNRWLNEGSHSPHSFCNLYLFVTRIGNVERKEAGNCGCTKSHVIYHHQNVYAAGDKILVPAPVQVRQSLAIELA